MKKIISMFLSVAVMVTLVTPVMASSVKTAESTVASGSAATTNKGMENAIKAVKEKIDIPKECNKFNYNIYTQNDVTYWNFGWSSEEDQKYINVTIDEYNLITNYSSYQYSGGYEKRIPKYSKEQGQEIAEKFINNIDKSLLSQFKLVDYNNYSVDREYYFNYIRKVNGIDYTINNIGISVNSYTGQVSNFNLSYSKDTKFEDASKIISQDQAKKAFMEKLGLKLVYNIKTENDKSVSYLAYIPSNPNKYIDAITGETEVYSGIYDIYYTTSMDAKMSAGAAGSNIVLTPEEVEAVEGMSGIISKEDADKKVRAIGIFDLGSSFELTNASLSKYWRDDDSLIWSLNYNSKTDNNQERSVQVSIDAKTGDVQNFWSYYPVAEGAKPQKTQDQAKAICDSILKSLVPNYYSKVKYDDTYYNYYEQQNQNQFTFRYVRMENGLECPGNNITITFDNLSGKVTNMNTSWTKNLTFAKPENVISLEEAYKVLFDKIGYQVQYVNDTSSLASGKIIKPVPNESENAVLGYFVNSTKPNVISAATGDILDFSGNVYKENSFSDYTDIKGIYGENQVRILTQLSIRYKEDQLKPDADLLQKDYFVVLCRLNDLYYIDQNADDEKDIDRMYNNLISQGIITKEEKSPTSTLTREEAAKYFVKFLRFGQIAEIKGIYKSDFKDADKINPDLLGYVCIASGLKAMNGIDGKFMPKDKITRLEALLSIYSYLSNK